MSRTVAVVQARLGSERLPRKVLVRLAGKPVLEHVVTAIRAAELVEDVVLATTTSAADDELVDLGHALGVRVFRGSEPDVLGRFYEALAGDPADTVLRLTADNPLLDPGVIDTVVRAFREGACDYASNNIQRSWPRGLDTEVLSREALERSHRDGRREEDREHVTIHIRTHPQAFRLLNVTAPREETWPELRLSLDTPEDQALLEAVFGELYVTGEVLPVRKVIDWLRHHPDVASLNATVEQKQVLGRAF